MCKYLLMPIFIIVSFIIVSCATQNTGIILNTENIKTGELNITYLGTACFLLQDGSHNILIDPGDFLTNRFPVSLVESIPELDLILVTHDDFDHCNRLKYLPDIEYLTIIGTETLKKKRPDYKISTSPVYENEWVQVLRIDIPHTIRTGVDHTGYIIHFAGNVIYFFGDGIKPKGEIAPYPDIMFVTIGGIEANIPNAIKLVNEIKPRCVIPMHWELFNRSDKKPKEFKEKLKELFPEIHCIIPPFYKLFTVPQAL